MPSEKVLEAKKAKVEQLTETLKNAVSFVIVDYKGITVEEDTKLRRDLRAENVKYSVEKNSLLRFALKNAGIEGLDDVLEGTTAIAVSNEDQTAPARVLGKYASEMDGKFNLKAGMVDGEIYDEKGVTGSYSGTGCYSQGCCRQQVRRRCLIFTLTVLSVSINYIIIKGDY